MRGKAEDWANRARCWRQSLEDKLADVVVERGPDKLGVGGLGGATSSALLTLNTKRYQALRKLSSSR